MAHKGAFPFDIRKEKIPVFKVGHYPQLETPANPFGLADVNLLREIADSYDPATFKAPITVDHEQFGKARGRFESFEVVGEKLLAKVESVADDFVAELAAGEWLYPSIELYFPDNPSNPSPGRFSVKAVTFLGAMAPQVKGLFSEDWEKPWEYIESDGGRVACLSELNRKDVSMTDKELKAKLDKAEADLAAAKKATEEAEAKFSEASEKSKAELKKAAEEAAKLKAKVDDLSSEKSAEFKEVQDENRKLKADFEKLEKRQNEKEAEALKASVASFCERMKSKGFYSPAVVDEKIKPRLEKLLDSPTALRESMESYEESASDGAFFREQGGERIPAHDSEKVTGSQHKLVASFSEENQQKGAKPATAEDCKITLDGYARFNEVKKSNPKAGYKELKDCLIAASMNTTGRAA